MNYRSCRASNVVIFITVAFISVREPAVFGFYNNPRQPNAGQQWQTQNQQAGPQGPQWQGSNQNPNPAPPSYYQNAAQNSQGQFNRTEHYEAVGHYESSAHSENGRKLGRMLDTYSRQTGDMGAALDKVAEIFQNRLQEAQQNQGQAMPGQNPAYTKRPWSSGYSKKPWVPYEEYIATRKAWSPSAFSKKTWSPWSKWSPGNEQQGYSPKAWSPNPAYSKKAWSPYQQKSWSPNPGYSKKPWSPNAAAGQTQQQKWGSGWYSNQPWVPDNNQQQQALFDGPGMDADDFAMDSPVVTETEAKSKRTRKEKSTTREVDAAPQTEPVIDGADDKMDHNTEPSFTKSGENVNADFNPNISIER